MFFGNIKIISLVFATFLFALKASTALESFSDLTHEQQVAKIAAPLFFDGTRKSDKKWTVKILSRVGEEEYETDRPLEDVTDIVRRTLEFCPAIVENTAGIMGRTDLKNPEAATSHVRHFAVCGFADVPLAERDTMLAQAKSIIRDSSALVRLAYALENLSAIKDKQKRSRLVDWANSKTDLNDEDKLGFINAISEAHEITHEDINCDEVVRLLPIVRQLLGVEEKQEEHWKYGVLRGIALNSTATRTAQLCRDVQAFLCSYKKKNDAGEIVACELSDYKYHEKDDSFDVIAHIPAHLRLAFIQLAKEVCPVTDSYLANHHFWSHLSILRSFTVYKSVEEVQAFLEQIKTIMPKDKQFTANIIHSFHRMLKPANLYDLLAHTLRLTTDPETNELTTDISMLQDVLDTLLRYGPKDRRTLIADVEEIAYAEALDWKQRNKLLKIAGAGHEHQERLSLMRGLSWQGKQTPTFKEQWSFLSSFYNSCVSSFPHFEDSFAVALNCASQYLTPELVERHRGFYGSEWIFSHCDQDYNPFGMDADDQAVLLTAVFKSSAYDNLRGVVDTAGKQIKRITDAKVTLTVADKARVILAVAKIDPSLRETKVKEADDASKACGDAYFAEFMKNLEVLVS